MTIRTRPRKAGQKGKQTMTVELRGVNRSTTTTQGRHRLQETEASRVLADMRRQIEQLERQTRQLEAEQARLLERAQAREATATLQESFGRIYGHQPDGQRLADAAARGRDAQPASEIEVWESLFGSVQDPAQRRRMAEFAMRGRG